MSESFKKLKKKFLRAALIKSAVVGVFSALLTVGILLLILKPNAIALHWGFYLLIGAGAAALAFGATFLFTRPTNKKVAKRLDADYALHEKVQTMVEFQDQEGDMLRLQRENTSEILKTVPRKRPSVKRLWQYILIPVLACAVFVTSIVIPAAKKEYIPPVDGYEITNWQETALAQLIGEVKTSALEDPVREPVVQALESLLSTLKKTNTGAVMRNEVISAVKKVDDTVAGANSYRDIVIGLAKTEEMKDFSTSITNAVASYKNNDKINSMAQVTSRAQESDQKISAALSAYTTEFTARFDELTERQPIVESLNSFLTQFNTTMANVTTVSEDKLYVALSDLSAAFGEIVQNGEYYESGALKEYIAATCADYVAAASIALEPQVYNCLMDEFIRNRLSEIFGISVSQFPSTELVLPGGTGSGDESGGDDDPSHSGGLGDGDIKYGSDDLVYDPNESEHVQYGSILDRYQTLYLNYFNDETTSALITDEMKSYISQYFNILYGNKAEDTESKN